MPIYEYRCEQCGHRFEAWLRSQSSPAPDGCPNCSAVEIKRVPSIFGGLRTSAETSAANSVSSCDSSGGT